MVRKRGGPAQLSINSRASDNIGLTLWYRADNDLRYFSILERTSSNLWTSWYSMTQVSAWSIILAVTSPTSIADKSLFIVSMAMLLMSSVSEDNTETEHISYAIDALYNLTKLDK